MDRLIVGRFELLERIGGGGMADVLLARYRDDDGDERLAAVKVLKPKLGTDQHFVAMFRDEARVMKRLVHPNVVSTLEHGSERGLHYMALAYLHGRDVLGILQRHVRLGQPVPIAHALHIIAEVCAGLDHAHNLVGADGAPMGLVHRDVSPQNIVVTFAGKVVVVDFGIALSHGRRQLATTRGGIVKGKLSYMSPEQACGDVLDRRSDVFSCGIVLYELLTGQRLFAASSPAQTIANVRRARVASMRAHNPAIPEALEAVVLQALARRPRDRFSNAAAFGDAVRTVAARDGLVETEADIAGWLDDMFRAERIAESARRSALWRRAQQRPLPRSRRRRTALDQTMRLTGGCAAVRAALRNR